MKTVGRMVRRYILAAFAVVVLVMVINMGLFLGIVVYFGLKNPGYFPIGKLAGSFSQTEQGDFVLSSDLQWQTHFAWAMLLSDEGNILWSESLPPKLNHPYTVPEVAAFSRWYLADYPVMVYRNDYGLLVAGKPIGSLTRFDLYMENDVLNALLSTLVPMLLVDLGLVLGICLWLGWWGAKPLRELAAGIELLAEGKSVWLEESGTTAELAEKLNQTSRRLLKQNELIQRRDLTRANWIAGVSHDIRTPLALIMGYGEQLAQQFPTDSQPQKKAEAICTQSEKIKALIEDLNLTFKLQYNAQPLRRTLLQMGPWLRRCVADFSDSLDDGYSVDLLIREPAGQSALELDGELLTRAIDNLLSNSVRHNPSGCEIQVLAQITAQQFVLEVRDNGGGYPQAILSHLSDTYSDANAPHILGLHLVQQIAAAHGGQAAFRNEDGAVAILRFPI